MKASKTYRNPAPKSSRTSPLPGRLPREAPAEAGAVSFSPLELRRILVPTDFSPVSHRALDYALPLADQYGAKVMLLHVVDTRNYPEALELVGVTDDNFLRSARDKLAKLARELIPARLLESAVVRRGSAYLQIAEAVRAYKVDLIVMATHGHTGVRRVLLGSTAAGVVRHAPCPVLTVRHRPGSNL